MARNFTCRGTLMRCVCPSVRPCLMSHRIAPIAPPLGARTAGAATARDVDARRSADRRLREAEVDGMVLGERSSANDFVREFAVPDIAKFSIKAREPIGPGRSALP